MANVLKLQRITHMKILAFAIYEKMTTASLLKVRRLNQALHDYVDEFIDFAKPQLDLQQLTIFQNRLFLAPRGTIQYVPLHDAQPSAIFDLHQNNIKELMEPEELLDIPNLVLHGIAALLPVIEEVRKAESIRLSLHACTVRVGATLVTKLSPKEVLMDANCQTPPGRFILHPAFKCVSSLSYAPYTVTPLTIPEWYKNVEVRFCISIEPITIRSFVTEWMTDPKPNHVRRLWGCTSIIDKMVEEIFKGSKKNRLWKTTIHNNSFLREFAIKELRLLNEVFTLANKTDENELLLAVITKHRLLLRTLNENDSDVALEEIRKNPNLLDEGVFLPGDQ